MRNVVGTSGLVVALLSCADGDEGDTLADATSGATATTGGDPSGDPSGAPGSVADTSMDGTDGDDDGSSSDDTGVSMPCGAYSPGLALEVCTAGYLAGPGSDGATAIAIGPDATVWWAGAIAGSDLGVTPTVLPGASDGALVHLASDGRSASSLTRFGARIEDVAIMPDGTVVVGGDAGVAALAPDGVTMQWSATPGAVVRVATDGDVVVALADGELHVLDGAGQAGASFSAGGGTINDLALAEGAAIVTGFKQDDGPPCTQLQIPFVRAFATDGTAAWSAYDWTKDEVGAQDQCADTRGMAVALGGDGLLYYAGESHGGNSVHQRMPDDVATDAPNHKTDPFDDPYGLNGAAPITYYARFDPVVGQWLAGQFLLTRLSDGKGNAARPKAIAADADGHVFVAGATACCIEDGAMRTVNGAPAMPEAYQGGGYVLVVAPDFSSRMTWTTFRGETGNGETAVAIATGAGNVAVALDQRLDEGSTTDAPLLSFSAIGPEPGGGPSDGYVVVFPAPSSR